MHATAYLFTKQNKTKHQSPYNENPQNVYNSLSLPKNLYNTTNTTTTTKIINITIKTNNTNPLTPHPSTRTPTTVVAGDRSGLNRS